MGEEETGRHQRGDSLADLEEDFFKAAEDPFADDVIISDPETVKFGMTSFTLYKVTLKRKKGPDLIVHKRYSDFVRLHGALANVLPLKMKNLPVPQKKLIGNFEISFVEKRMQDLQQFLRAIIDEPALAFHQITWNWFIV